MFLFYWGEASSDKYHNARIINKQQAVHIQTTIELYKLIFIHVQCNNFNNLAIHGVNDQHGYFGHLTQSPMEKPHTNSTDYGEIFIAYSD